MLAAPFALVARTSAWSSAPRASGAGIRTEGFRWPDLCLAILLAGLFTYAVAAGWSKAATPAPIKIDQVLPSSLTLLSIAVIVAGFLAYRGADLIRLFGFAKISIWSAAGWALLLLIAAVPLVLVATFITANYLQGGADEQQLVLLFKEEARQGRYRGVATIVIAGVFLAPVVEEFLFRGYFYGVFKRYLGAAAAAILSAALFAAFHMNLTSIPGLFTLALCLTAAYERRGSLLVPMGMHALFNLSNLVLLYYQATASAER